MKKVLACILLAGTLLVPAGCTGNTEGSGASTGPLAESAAPSVAQSPAPDEGTAQPAWQPSTEPAPAQLDEDDFAAFIEGIGLGYFAGGDIPAGTSVNETLTSWGMNLVPWTLNHALVTQGQTSDFIFPIEDLTLAANELFGGRCDYKAWIESGAITMDGDIPEGYLRIGDGFCLTYNGEPDWDTLSYENGVAEITLAYDSQEGSYWLTRFAFAPRPGNQVSPYELLSAEVLFRQALVEPEVYFEKEQRYTTTANLNLRRGPGTEYDPPMYTIPAGEEILVAGKMAEGYEDWVFLYSGMSGGWVNTEYIEKVEP